MNDTANQTTEPQPLFDWLDWLPLGGGIAAVVLPWLTMKADVGLAAMMPNSDMRHAIMLLPSTVTGLIGVAWSFLHEWRLAKRDRDL